MRIYNLRRTLLINRTFSIIISHLKMFIDIIFNPIKHTTFI